MRDPDGSLAAPISNEALAQLYRTCRLPMVRLAYVLTRDSDIADDLVQDAFVAVHRNWAQVERPEAYLRTAVVNACHSHHRHLRVARESLVTHRTTVADTATFDQELHDALGCLPFNQRAVLALRYFDDLDDVEIAAALGIRRSTVRTRAHRALAKLRKELN